MAGPDYSGIKAGISSGYDYQRQKAAQQENANLQGQKDALARQAAALGGGPSGAFIKADQMAGDASAQRLQQANEGINQAQAQEMRGVDQTQLGQQFQTSERLGGQQFQQGNLDKQNALAVAGLTGTYNGQDTFAKQQATMQNKLAEAGLTGQYNGGQTLASQAFDNTKDQQKFENKQNSFVNMTNLIANLKDKYGPDAMEALFSGLPAGTFGDNDPHDLLQKMNPAAAGTAYGASTGGASYKAGTVYPKQPGQGIPPGATLLPDGKSFYFPK